MTNANDPELLAMAEKIIASPEHIARIEDASKSVTPADPNGILARLCPAPDPEGPADAETLSEAVNFWRVRYWAQRRMLEHIAETEGEDAAVRMRQIAKDALAGKAYGKVGP